MRAPGSPPEPHHGNRRARLRLSRAPSEPCPNCGRVTKTVDGECAECWGQKVIDARVVRRPPRTEPLGIFDSGSFGPVLVGAVVAAGMFLTGAVLAWILG